MEQIRRPSPELVDYQLYRQRALRERNQFLRGGLPPISPKIRRRLTAFATAFAVASGAFWATMLTDPPRTVAASDPVSVHELQQRAPLNLPIGEADAH